MDKIIIFVHKKNLLNQPTDANHLGRNVSGIIDQGEIVTELAPIMKRECPRLPPTPDNTINWFLDRVKLNLHVVICFSPIGETFRIRSLKFPALVSGCTIDW